MTKLFAVLAAVATVVVLPTSAHAYHPIPSFHTGAENGGGGRIYYTGSPAQGEQTCGSCHVDAPGDVRFELSATPEDIFETGRYEPGQVYRVTVSVSGAEGKGLRTWMLETLDDFDLDVGNYLDIPGGCTSGQQTPRSCLQPSCNFICKNVPGVRETCSPDGTSICSELTQIPGCGQCASNPGECVGCPSIDGVIGGAIVLGAWQFDFIAPAPGTGPINVYLGGVAGTSDHTSMNDDYHMSAYRLCEGADDCAPDASSEGEEAGDYEPGESAGGCAASGKGRGSAAALVVLVFLFGRRRFSR